MKVTTTQTQRGVAGELDSMDIMVNMGPQHPSTHGVFRLAIWIDGERIVRAEPHIGYLHRGSEKLSEGESYNQVITLFDRLDYIANLNSELAFCTAVEKLMAIEVPERAEYVRVILSEMNRIASHMLFYGVYGLDAGAMTPDPLRIPGAGEDPVALRGGDGRPNDAPLLLDRWCKSGPASRLRSKDGDSASPAQAGDRGVRRAAL